MEVARNARSLPLFRPPGRKCAQDDGPMTRELMSGCCSNWLHYGGDGVSARRVERSSTIAFVPGPLLATIIDFPVATK
jgi:hypothetical protein